MQDRSQFIRDIKKMIGNAELEAALDRVIAYLDEKDGYEDLARTALHLRADYRQTAQDESRGILSRDDAKLSYNQVTHRLLDLLDNLAKDTPQQKVRRRNIWAGIAAAALLLAATGVWFVANRTPSGPPPSTALEDCPPQFSGDPGFKILCLPFFDLRENSLQSGIGISRAIQDRLSRLSSEYQIQSRAGLYNFPEENIRRYPSAPQDADNYGADCEAQLVIWGSFEKQPNNDIITTNWRLVNRGEGFRLRKLRLDEGIDIGSDTITTLIETWGYEVDTTTSLTSIMTEGVLTERVENLLLLIFGVISHQTNNREAAIATLENVRPSNEQELILRNCLLAENYLAEDQPERAMASYDEVLQAKPDYPLALNNRALIYYRKGLYEEAAQDLSAHLQANPGDANARIARGSAYLKAEQLDKAREDFQSAKEAGGNERVIRKRESELKTQVREQKELQKQAERKLQQDPDNIQALTSLVDASSKLGEHQTAARAAERIIAKEPNNVAAFSKLVRSYEALRLPDKVRETIKKAESTGIRPEFIIPRSAPLLRIDTSRQ